MTVATAVLKRAPVTVRLCLELRSPHRALRVAVVEDVHFAPEVLPVVRVHAVVPRVRLVTIGTPCSLKMEDVEIQIAFHFVEVVNGKLVLMVGKGTHIAVAALAQLVGVVRAELGLVLFWVVEVFDCVVRFGTFVTKRAV